MSRRSFVRRLFCPFQRCLHLHLLYGRQELIANLLSELWPRNGWISLWHLCVGGLTDVAVRRFLDEVEQEVRTCLLRLPFNQLSDPLKGSFRYRAITSVDEFLSTSHLPVSEILCLASVKQISQVLELLTRHG